MTPIDDEVRRALHAQASSVPASPDPLAGVERRVRGIRRRRTAAAGLTAAAAVAAVALAVPSLVTSEREPAVRHQLTTPSASASPSPSADVPDNLLGWGLRGRDAVSPSTLDLRTRFAQKLGREDVAASHYSPLYVDELDGVAFTTGQAWFDGGPAYTVSYAVGPDKVPQLFLGPVTPADPWGLAFVVNGPGRQLLVVVPSPRTGQVSYAPHATGAFQPATGPTYADGVVVIDRDLQASDDRLQVLDGNGDLDRPMYQGPVTPLLCGLNEC